jgi:hypothetical protein
MRTAAAMLKSSCPVHLRRPLHRAVAQLAHTCGYSAFDIGNHAKARSFFAFALSCAQRSGDGQTEAYILSSMVRQAISLGLLENGLAFAEQGLAATDRLTATERAMLHAVKSRCLAAAGDVPGAIQASNEADSYFEQSSPAADPPWMRYYDQAQHYGDTGTAMLNLAVLGHDRSETRARMMVAFKERRDIYPRSRAMAQIKLATLSMATGDPHEAIAIGTDALSAIKSIRSNQIRDSLKTLNRYAAKRNDLAVRTFRHLLVQVVDSTWARPASLRETGETLCRVRV